MNVLVLYASLRPAESVTQMLAKTLLNHLKERSPHLQVKERFILPNSIKGPDAFWVEANRTPEHQRTPEMKTALAQSDELVREIQEASHIILASPMYNFSIAWTLKAYIDLIVRAGHTFGFDASTSNFFPLLKNKKLALLSASAADYSQAPYNDFDLCEHYVRIVFGFMGIADVMSAKAENRWMKEDARHNSEASAVAKTREIAAQWMAS